MQYVKFIAPCMRLSQRRGICSLIWMSFYIVFLTAVLHDEADLYVVCADLFLGNGCVVVACGDERCVGLI